MPAHDGSVVPRGHCPLAAWRRAGLTMHPTLLRHLLPLLLLVTPLARADDSAPEPPASAPFVVCDADDPQLQPVIERLRADRNRHLAIDVHSAPDGSVEINLARTAGLAEDLGERLRRQGIVSPRLHVRVHAELNSPPGASPPTAVPADCTAAWAVISEDH